MAYTNLFTNVVCDTSSQLKCTAGYEYQRVGNDMQYRYQITLSAPNTYFTGDLIGVEILQDGVQVLIGTFYDPDGSDTNGWTYTGVTAWFTTANKLTGSTSVRFRVYDNQGSSSYNKYIPSSTTNYTMLVSPASSTVSATNAYIGSATQININRFSASYYHRLYVTILGQAEAELTSYNGSDVTYSYTLPTSIYALIPNALSIGATVRVKTYSDVARTVQIGTDQTNTFTASVNPTTNAPTVSGTVVDVDAVIRSGTPLTTSNNVIVKSRSDAQYSITSTAKNSATIVSRSITCGTAVATTATGTITNAQSNVFTLSTTDSRGLIGTATVTKTLINYLPLSCSFSLSRTSAVTENKVRLTMSGNYWASNFGLVANTLSIRFRYKELGGTFSSWINIANAITVTSGGVTITGNAYSISSWILENGSGVDLTVFDYLKSYLFEFQAFDKLDTLSYTEAGGNSKTVSSSLTVYDIYKDKMVFNVPVYANLQSIGDNLIPESDFEAPSFIGWTLNNSPTLSDGSSTRSIDGKNMKMVTSVTSSGVYQSVTGLIIGQPYTFSLWAYVESGSWNFGENAATKTQMPVGNSWVRYSHTFTATSTSHAIIIYTYAAITNSTIYIDCVKLELGPVATAWIPKIESGSNANGNYIRYPDGTLVCTLRTTVTDQAIDTAYNTTLFTGSRSWTFPFVFVGSNPTVTCSLFRWGSSSSWGGVNATASNTSVILRGYDNVTRAVGTSVVISAMAIGRWKA